MVRHLNQYFNTIENGLKIKIEAAFKSIKKSGSNEEIAHNRGILEGLRDALHLVEYVKNEQ